MNFYYYYSNLNTLCFLILVILVICSIILLLCYILSGNNLYNEKASGYECGFDPFSDAREPFYVKFYLIAILFIVFDVEIIFFFPWIFSLLSIGIYGIFIMFIVISIFLIGFLYEWKKGSLDWD